MIAITVTMVSGVAVAVVAVAIAMITIAFSENLRTGRRCRRGRRKSGFVANDSDDGSRQDTSGAFHDRTRNTAEGLLSLSRRHHGKRYPKRQGEKEYEESKSLGFELSLALAPGHG